MDLTRLREQVSLEGKVAIVTGAFHKGGIGLAAAKELAARGAEIVLTDRPPYAAYAGAAQAALKKMGSYAVGVTADTFTPEGAKQVADAALNAFGAIDILINTAPLYCDYRRIEQVPDQDWQAAYEGNILGTAEICRAVIPHMAKRGGEMCIRDREGTGIFQWPLPESFTITPYFGSRNDPFTGQPSYHDGTDIAAPAGTPVLAAAAGTVEMANGTDPWGGG